MREVLLEISMEAGNTKHTGNCRLQISTCWNRSFLKTKYFFHSTNGQLKTEKKVLIRQPTFPLFSVPWWRYLFIVYVSELTSDGFSLDTSRREMCEEEDVPGDEKKCRWNEWPWPIIPSNHCGRRRSKLHRKTKMIYPPRSA
jgi:hypothetical protein